MTKLSKRQLLQVGEKWVWLWREFNKKKEKNIREAVIKLLAFHPIIRNEKDEIERVGLSKYDLSHKTPFGTEKSIPKYRRVKDKPSYASISERVIPEMERNLLIFHIDTVKSHSGKDMPLYILTYNGLIFALCLLNKNFEHTEELLRIHLEVLDYYKIDTGARSPAILLKNFLTLSKAEQKRYLENYVQTVNRERLSEEEIKELSRFEWLLTRPRHAFYYQFFLLPVILSTDKEMSPIFRKCWLGREEIFRDGLQYIIDKHISSFDSFREKIDLPLEDIVSIEQRIRDEGTAALLFWIGSGTNAFIKEKLGNLLKVNPEEVSLIYQTALHWGINEFIRLTKSEKEEDKELLKKIISYRTETKET